MTIKTVTLLYGGIIPARRLMSACPFCHAEQSHDKLHTRIYACGTTASRETAIYARKCGERRF